MSWAKVSNRLQSFLVAILLVGILEVAGDFRDRTSVVGGPGPVMLSELTEVASDVLDIDKLSPSKGYMTPLIQAPVLTLSYARARVADRGGGYTTWQNSKVPIGATSTSTDREIYFVNGYFREFAPENLTSPWLISKRIASIIKYERDQTMFGLPDVWLTGAELYHSRRGDCEDHSILLADWLVSLGYDARVVLGRVPRGGHAWVVLFDGPKVYLFEAVDKKPKRMPPLAKLTPDFYPELMFNHEYLWENTGGDFNMDYTSSSWRRTARYSLDAPVSVEPKPKPIEESKKSESVVIPQPKASPTPRREERKARPAKLDFPAYYRVLVNSKLFTSPSFTAEAKGSLPVGERIRVLGVKGHWLEIESANGTLWYLLAQDAAPELSTKPHSSRFYPRVIQ